VTIHGGLTVTLRHLGWADIARCFHADLYGVSDVTATACKEETVRFADMVYMK
jgi:hypothetical protein